MSFSIFFIITHKLIPLNGNILLLSKLKSQVFTRFYRYFVGIFLILLTHYFILSNNNYFDKLCSSHFDANEVNLKTSFKLTSKPVTSRALTGLEKTSIN